MNPPWVDPAEPNPLPAPTGGIEVELIEGFARELGTRVTWVVGSEQELMTALETFQLQVVAGGLRADNPHLAAMGRSREYGEPLAEREHVMATAPGENRFVVALDTYLHAHAREVVRARLEALAEQQAGAEAGR